MNDDEILKLKWMFILSFLCQWYYCLRRWLQGRKSRSLNSRNRVQVTLFIWCHVLWFYGDRLDVPFLTRVSRLWVRFLDRRNMKWDTTFWYE
jgi:hypothetical protein